MPLPAILGDKSPSRPRSPEGCGASGRHWEGLFSTVIRKHLETGRLFWRLHEPQSHVPLWEKVDLFARSPRARDFRIDDRQDLTDWSPPRSLPGPLLGFFHGTFAILRRLYKWRSRYVAEN